MSIRKGSTIIAGSGGGSGGGISVDDIDGTTITLNSSNKLQSSGVIEKNNGDAKYDWIGTYEEWLEGRNDSSIDDSWICYITDDENQSHSKSRTIGEIIFSLIPLEDSSLHLLDGSLIDGTGVYSQFYTYMKNLYENGYTKCFTTEANWQASDSAYNACGKFVLDTSNQTIRLPEVQGIVEGTLDEDALGELVEAGLPNITGQFGNFDVWGFGDTAIRTVEGAFGFEGNKTNLGKSVSVNSGTTSDDYRKANFDASRSNSIYGNSDTVQPQTIKGYYYIVVATSMNLDISVDIDNVVNDLSNKADKNLSNIDSNIDYVVEYQAPTSSESRWYRLYKSGWVEQGGISDATTGTTSPTFLITMADAYYAAMACSSGGGKSFAITAKTTTSITLQYSAIAGSSVGNASWEVKGFAASGS